jgi:hypothetical protein
MVALRYAALLALVAWVGGLLALGAFAAPAAFDVLQARAAENGRVLAGAVFGETLRRFTLTTYVCGVLLLLTLAIRGILGPRPRRFALRVAIGVLMLAATAASGLYFAPRIEGLQRSIGMSVASLPDDDARRVEFGRLHGLSTTIQLVPLLGGLALLYWELRE